MEGSLRPAGVEELPEEDQEEGEMPTLPPGKDPSSSKLTNPLLMKGAANNKQMVRVATHIVASFPDHAAWERGYPCSFREVIKAGSRE